MQELRIVQAATLHPAYCSKLPVIMTALQHHNMFVNGKNRLRDIDSDINGITRELRLLHPTRVGASFYEELVQVKTTVSDTYKWLQQAEEDDEIGAAEGLAAPASEKLVIQRLDSVWEQYIRLVNKFTEYL